MDPIQTLTDIALDLTTAMGETDRYQRLLTALGRVIPYDGAALLRLEKDHLVPVAARGLKPEAVERKYLPGAHPRLGRICNAEAPVHFAPDDPMPDPFDGELMADPQALGHIHACLGCPLRVGSRLLGVLTADAMDPAAFDHLDPRVLEAVAAMAGAQMQTARLMEALEARAQRQGQIAGELMADIQRRQGMEMIGQSPAMDGLRKELALVGPSDFPVLILGETGTGKELAARAIHRTSSRRGAPMLYLNCAAIPESLAESELFGHVRGAYSGADKDRAGKFELADQGTLFLDEIGEMPLGIQAKLLRALQEGEVQPLGGNRMVRVDVRILAATNRDLEAEVKKGNFRADLYHRINVYPVTIPPLRARLGDIPLLTDHFCGRLGPRMGVSPLTVSADALKILESYAWPGNIRELENVLSRAALKAASRVGQGGVVSLQPWDLARDLIGHSGGEYRAMVPPALPQAPGLSLREAVVAFQKEMIQSALEHSNGNWAAAARELGMHRSNLHHLARRLGLKTGAPSGRKS